MGKYPVLVKVSWYDDGIEGISRHLIYADDFQYAGKIIDEQYGDTSYEVSFFFLEGGLVCLSEETYNRLRKEG